MVILYHMFFSPPCPSLVNSPNVPLGVFENLSPEERTVRDLGAYQEPQQEDRNKSII